MQAALAKLLKQPWLILLLACAGSPAPEGVEVTGVIRFQDVEGGIYRLETDDGGRYQLLDLAEAFREDGLPVRATIRIESDVMTTGQAGTPARVLHIERLSGR